MTRGIIYKTTGDQYIKEACISARSSKSVMPDVETAIITDQSVNNECFDYIIECGELNEDFSNKIISAGESPFDKTLYLDTDTYILEDVSSLFELLDDYDIAAAMSSTRTKVPDLPEPYREFNTGVYLFNNTNEIDSFFDSWSDKYWKWREERNILPDQPSFASSIYESDLNVFTLPKEYNCSNTIGFLGFDAKIMHGRPVDTLQETANVLNNFRGKNQKRIYFASPRLKSSPKISMFTIPASDKSASVPTRLVQSSRTNGIRYTFNSAVFEIASELSSRRSLKTPDEDPSI